MRLKCSNPLCRANFTAYPYDVLPGYRHNPAIISKLTAACLSEPSGLERAMGQYKCDRELRIEDGESGGPDVSTLRRWLRKLSEPASVLSLFLSAKKQLTAPINPPIMVVFLAISLATQLLKMPLASQGDSSPTAQVTENLNRVNGCVSSQKDQNFYNQEHPP